MQFVDDFLILEIQYFNHYFFEKNHTFHGHRHDSWEINVVLDGEIEITYDDTIFTLKKGEGFFGEPNVFHRNQIRADNSVELIVIHFTTHLLPTLFSPHIFSLTGTNLDLFQFAISDLERFNDSNRIFSSDVEIAPFSFKKLLEVFISRIIKENITLPRLNKKETIVYNTAVTYMKNNLYKSCSISEIATHCCVCSTTLKTIFKKYTGQGVNTFFINMKLEYSKCYLRQGYSMAEISELLGFTSQAYFSQTFKSIYGYPPLKYKNQNN